MKFSVDIDEKLVALCEEEIKQLRPAIRSKSAYFNLLLSLRFGLIQPKLAELLENPCESKLRSSSAVAGS